MLVYVIDNPLTDFRSSIVLAAFNLNLRRADIGIKACSYCLTNLRTFFLKSKVLKEHGSRQNLSYRVGDVFTGSLRPRTMNRLKEWSVLTK